MVDDTELSLIGLRDLFTGKLLSAPPAERENLREQLLRTRFSLPLNRAEVQQSLVHGRGVFATCDISEGEIITMYPGDAIMYYPVTEAGISETRDAILFGSHLQGSLRDEVIVKDAYLRYAYDVDGYYAIVGCPDLVGDAAYVGHMCNDGASLCSSSGTYQRKYIEASTKCNNAAFESILDAHVAVIARTKILRGEEVLVSYGVSYWVSAIAATSAMDGSK